MPPTDIAELRRLHEAATEGDWVADYESKVGTRCILKGDAIQTFPMPAADAVFIAAAHNALPALLDELEELREEITELRLKHSRLRHIHAEAVTLLAGVVNSGDISTAAKMLVSSISNIEDAKQLLDARDRRMKLTGAAEWLEQFAGDADGNIQITHAWLRERAAQLRREAGE